MIVTVVLLVVLVVPLVAWVGLRWWPAHRARRTTAPTSPKDAPAGPKHRWWQP